MRSIRIFPISWMPGCLACLLLVVCPRSAVADTEWQLAKEEDGVTVFTRDVENSLVKQFKASTKVSASLATVLAVMLDSAACPEWIYRCEDAKVLKRNSFADSYVYRKINLPWPVSDRDIVMRKRVMQDPQSKIVTIKNTSAPDFVPRTGDVRIEVSESVYVVQPLDDGTVELTWTQLSDPAGALPKALVNSMIVTSPFSTLKSLHEMVKKDKYKRAKLKYDDQGRLVGFADGK